MKYSFIVEYCQINLIGTTFAQRHSLMVSDISNIKEVNVLASVAGWAWPSALQDIFKPRGVNLMVARNSTEFVDVIEQRRIHTAIVDMDTEKSNGLATIKLIRSDYPRLPA